MYLKKSVLITYKIIVIVDCFVCNFVLFRSNFLFKRYLHLRKINNNKK